MEENTVVSLNIQHTFWTNYYATYKNYDELANEIHVNVVNETNEGSTIPLWKTIRCTVSSSKYGRNLEGEKIREFLAMTAALVALYDAYLLWTRRAALPGTSWSKLQ